MDAEDWIPPELVRLLVELGHLDEVERQAALGDWHCVWAWAQILVERGEHDAALGVTAPFMGWWTAAHSVADLLVDWGRYAEAEALVRPHANTGETDAIALLATALVRRGRDDEAFELLRPRVETWSLARTLVELFRGRGRDAQLSALLKASIQRVGLLAEMYERDGRIDDAITLLGVNLCHNGSWCLGNVQQLARLLDAEGRLAELRELPVGPLNEEAFQAVACYRAAAGDIAGAAELLKQFIAKGSPNSTVLLAELLAGHGRIEEAVSLLRPMALSEGGMPYYAEPSLLSLLIDHGRPEQALAFLNEVTAIEGMTYDLLHLEVEVLRRCGRPEEALIALRAHPEGRSWRSTIAELLVEAGRWDEVIAMIGPPYTRGDLTALAQALIRQGRVSEAISRLRYWRPTASRRSRVGAPPF